MKPLESLSPKTEFAYWIENFLISNIRANRLIEIKAMYENGKLTDSYESILDDLLNAGRNIQ